MATLAQLSRPRKTLGLQTGQNPFSADSGGFFDLTANGGQPSDYTGMASTASPGTYPGTGLNQSAPIDTRMGTTPLGGPTAFGNPPSPVQLPQQGVSLASLSRSTYDNSPEALARTMAIRNGVAPGAGIINPGMWGGGGPGGGPGSMDPVNVGTNMIGNPNLPQHAGNGHDMGQTQQGDERNGMHRDPNWRPPAFDWSAYASGNAQPHNPADWANKFIGSNARRKF